MALSPVLTQVEAQWAVAGISGSHGSLYGGVATHRSTLQALRLAQPDCQARASRAARVLSPPDMCNDEVQEETKYDADSESSVSCSSTRQDREQATLLCRFRSAKAIRLPYEAIRATRVKRALRNTANNDSPTDDNASGPYNLPGINDYRRAFAPAPPTTAARREMSPMSTYDASPTPALPSSVPAFSPLLYEDDEREAWSTSATHGSSHSSSSSSPDDSARLECDIESCLTPRVPTPSPSPPFPVPPMPPAPYE